ADGVLLMPGATGLDVRAWVATQGWVDPTRPSTTRAGGLEIAIERGPRDQPERYTRIVVLP
ncbi:general secretion pathway protein GspJ, partial [Bordetella petrii]|nr:general secretion pathway protein GspJ [Bordetella petrii]